MNHIVFINKHIEHQDFLLVVNRNRPLPSCSKIVTRNVGIAFIGIIVLVKCWQSTQRHVALQSCTTKAVVSSNDHITIAQQRNGLNRINTDASKGFTEVPFIGFVSHCQETIHIIESKLIRIVSVIANHNRGRKGTTNEGRVVFKCDNGLNRIFVKATNTHHPSQWI